MKNIDKKNIKLEQELIAAKKEIASLKKCKSKFDLLVNHMDEFVWILDKELEFTYISPSVSKVLGFSEEEFLTKFAKDFIPSKLKESIRKSYVDRKNGGAEINQKLWSTQINHKNGTLIWIESSTNSIINNNGEFDRLIGISRDVTLQKTNEKELQESEYKFRSFFEKAGSAMSIQTTSKILMVNKAFEKVFGYTQEEAKKLNPLDLVHQSQRNVIAERGFRRLEDDEVIHNFIMHVVDKKLHNKWLDISATPIDYEGQKATLIIGTDITDRKKNDLELNKFSTGIMNSPSSIVITDIDGTIEYVNPFFTEFTGYSYEEAVGANPKILNSGNNPKEKFEDLWSTILRGDVWNGELQNKKKNGELYWESIRIAPIIDENGMITNFIAIKEDVTERIRTLELIEQSEMDLREINAKKDKFFSIIAHDLRSPFSGLAGLTEVLKSSIKDLSEKQVDNYLELISESTQNIFKLLENLLAWAKTQTGRIEFSPKKENLKKIVDEVVSIVAVSAKNKEIEIIVDVNENTTVFADKNMLNTILRNIISNALKYTHIKGEVKIFAEVREIKDRYYNVIGVRDNGVGIPLGQQDKIFNIEHNYTTVGTEKEKGTGLGLILCKEFVEKHSGKIWCKSEENNGSTFYFSLPHFK